MDKNYKFSVENDDFESVQLLEDTEKILSVLYTDYLATDEEREVILNKEKILADKNKKELPKIEIKEIFAEPNKNTVFKENDLVKANNEKWYMKLLNFVKCLFK